MQTYQEKEWQYESSKQQIDSHRGHNNNKHFPDRNPHVNQLQDYSDWANSSQKVTQLKAMQQLADTAPVQRFANNTGLPDNLKSGIENLSGYSMNDVKVHYNSDKPTQLNAHAYAQGSEIHLAPGQEKHLAHEAWHVVQQKQGRVQATKQLKGKVAINDDTSLEREADVMGAKALNSSAGATNTSENNSSPSTGVQQQKEILPGNAGIVQRTVHSQAGQVIINDRSVPPLSQNARARLDSAMAILVAMLDHDQNIDIHRLIISIEQEGGPTDGGGISTIVGDNPAQTTTVQNPPPFHPSIQVTIQRAFAQKATEGELLGMLAHEIGVHNIPSEFRGVQDQNVNVFAPIITPRKQNLGNTPSGGYEFDNWAPQVNGVTPYRDGNRQHDHVMVSDILRTPYVVGGQNLPTRANIYFETVLAIGDEVWNGPGTNQEKRAKCEDLIHLYLVDIARIVASDDGRMEPEKHFVALSDVYGEVFTQVVLPQRGNHPWIPQNRPKENWVSLSISLGAFIAKVKLEKKING
ncbi:MAG: hypothetical protein CHH17_09795 [Candidatus Fluviicola riflensis]|nr:MAG: hypothetical protein CHH17_09795 [Candidatus Fluviicola riflensis]